VPADIKRNSFAFKMSGNSMSSLKGKSISADTIIVASNVFKNSNESLNNKVVVALVNNAIYIREYVVEGDNAFLIAWNDNSVMFPPIQVNETVQVLACVQYGINQF
jgi:SOS-response transcriptional repressor LexA